MGKIDRCPKCGELITDEMIEANMCWECGKILDESLAPSEDDLEIKQESFSFDYDSENPIHLMTTGFGFEGYRITEYHGIVSGECILGTGFLSGIGSSISDFFGVEAKRYSKKISAAKQIAIYYMCKEATELKCNAIIGISFGYMTIPGKDLLGVSVSGTAVLVEPKARE